MHVAGMAHFAPAFGMENHGMRNLVFEKIEEWIREMNETLQDARKNKDWAMCLKASCYLDCLKQIAEYLDEKR